MVLGNVIKFIFHLHVLSLFSLSFLPGLGTPKNSETLTERPVSLTNLISRIKQGSGPISGFQEDPRNISKTSHPLYYGSFGSHGPSYDSTFANLTSDETDLINNTYGDDVGVQYAESIINFSRSCDYAMFIVDHLVRDL